MPVCQRAGGGRKTVSHSRVAFPRGDVARPSDHPFESLILVGMGLVRMINRSTRLDYSLMGTGTIWWDLSTSLQHGERFCAWGAVSMAMAIGFCIASCSLSLRK